MPNNKKVWHIHELVSKQITILNMPFHMKSANILESSQYEDEFVGISYSFKYSKYFKGLPKDMH